MSTCQTLKITCCIDDKVTNGDGCKVVWYVSARGWVLVKRLGYV